MNLLFFMAGLTLGAIAGGCFVYYFLLDTLTSFPDKQIQEEIAALACKISNYLEQHNNRK
jgi:hypothetical protein